MNNIVISLENISKRFKIDDDCFLQNDQVRDGYFYALEDISLSIKSGSCTIITGANGSGKSLLMSIIAGLEDPASGTVQTSTRIGLVFQEPDSQILGETPAEDIAFGPRNLKLSKEQVKIRVNTALEKTSLSGKADFPARSLSGGEKRRLATAGILAMDAEIIIFDEPYANLDFHGILQVNRLFRELLSDGKTVIILTHEIEKCMALATNFIILFKGKKVFDGSTADALLIDLESYGIHHPLKKTVSNLEDLLW